MVYRKRGRIERFLRTVSPEEVPGREFDRIGAEGRLPSAAAPAPRVASETFFLDFNSQLRVTMKLAQARDGIARRPAPRLESTEDGSQTLCDPVPGVALWLPTSRSVR